MLSNLLDPAAVAGVADLELLARTLVEGAVSGLHISPFHGYSAEFTQYREYRPGDDLKYVDWKLLARTDRVYTKQFRETTNLSALLVIDASGSMAFADAGGPSKLRVAQIAAAALAYLISGQGDAVGALADSGAGRSYVAPRTGPMHLRRVLAHAAGVTAHGAGRIDEAIARGAELLGRRGLLIVLSDFYDREDETSDALRRARRMGHDVSILQIVTRAEREFPYAEGAELRDLESGRTVLTHGPRARDAYRDAFASFVARWRDHAYAEGIDYALVTTETPLTDTLRTYLLKRRRG